MLFYDSTSPALNTAHEIDWATALDLLLRRRSISAGIELLDRNEPQWQTLECPLMESADFLLTLAQWVDVGYRDAPFLRRMRS